MSKSHRAVGGGKGKQTSQEWYVHWRERIRNWVKKHSDADTADILIAVPDLFMLCLGLLGDARVPPALKIRLTSAVAYVISPIDFLPEAVMGAPGLVDDAGVLVFALHAALQLMNLDPETRQQVLLQHWHGDDDPVPVVRRLFSWLMKNGKRLFGGLWQIFRRKHYKSRRPRRTARYKTIPIT